MSETIRNPRTNTDVPVSQWVVNGILFPPVTAQTANGPQTYQQFVLNVTTMPLNSPAQQLMTTPQGRNSYALSG